MRIYILTLNLVFFCLASVAQDWATIKAESLPIIAIADEYEEPYQQPLSSMGWEDGVHISPDGSSLYCTYVPIDLLSFVLNGDLPNNFSASYLRDAPTYGMDLTSNPIGSDEWLHSDILYARKNQETGTFDNWVLSDMARDFYSEGAPNPLFSEDNSSVEFMLFTSNENETNNTDIRVIAGTSANPSGVGASLSTTINTDYNEDNPELKRIDENTLVLFFDSDNLPCGLGDNDIWYSVSQDNGETWSTPANVSSVNSSEKEHQPFLYQEQSSGDWYLYYAAYHSDGKLAIFRRSQLTIGDWDSWDSAELVIGAGTSAGVGEPTLTTDGSISFVVIYEDPEANSSYNHYDADAWFVEKKASETVTEVAEKESQITLYPNPAKDRLTIQSDQEILQVGIYNHVGQIVSQVKDREVDVLGLASGLYTLRIELSDHRVISRKFLKE